MQNVYSHAAECKSNQMSQFTELDASVHLW